ncbi:MAG: phosphoribosylformylglycinamidine synthase subunit PurL [Phycisphaerae bacterium]|nr:phosphoribosylformylglycinamidine synthase subunit PurL [Phycisphaerae bacterium]
MANPRENYNNLSGVPIAHRHWQVCVRPANDALDVAGRALLADVHQAEFRRISAVGSSKYYFLVAELDADVVERLAGELLADPVAERFLAGEGFSRRDTSRPAVEVHPLPGVMNPAALSTLDAARRWLARNGWSPDLLHAVQTGRRYEIEGARDAEELERIAARVLANDCVETWYVQGFGRNDVIPDALPEPPQRPFELRRVSIRELDDAELEKLSRQGHLFLSLDEMRAIRDHFRGIDREPTDLELETLAQTWSEHCVHKTLKSEVIYRGPDFGRDGEVEVRFENLLKDTIAAATRELAREWCLSVFVDNAGVIAFDDEYGIAFKVETHNHPSAIEPYGGAATGIGGCIRDIMGCGLGAKPIASTDVFCLAPPDFDAARLPAGVLHPRRVLKGVVAGVRDYGNRMGIPTVNGAIHFDPRYLGNPLVYCGCVGLIPRKYINKEPRVGDRIVVAGGRTGRDGIHGATFSSAELTDTHADEFSHAVQIGNAIEEKKLLDAQLRARDHADGCLFSAVTDCGAGGLSSAVGEMGAELGARVELSRVPLKYAGLRYDEIWISEAQERMVFAVPPDRLDRFLKVFAEEEVEATVIGEFIGDGRLSVYFEDQLVGELDMRFLHDGLPKRSRSATWTAPRVGSVARRNASKARLNERLLAALAHWTVASKEWVIRQYDHEVQGRGVIKPLVGPRSGPSDAAVLRPRYDSDRGIALGCGLCPEVADVDPYFMAIGAVDEALRNVICVGADPSRTAILDNFCWPKVDSEQALGTLVRACRGAADVAVAYGLPFISGKDSLNNQFSMSAEESARTGLPRNLAIPPTLLISAIGIVEDVNRCITMDLKAPGNVVVLAAASEAQAFRKARMHEGTEARSGEATHTGIPHSASTIQHSIEHHRRVADRICSGTVRAAHDVSDGGIAVALAEMCIGSGSGLDVSIDPDTPLFDSLIATYILEMSEADAKTAGWMILGKVTDEPRLRVDAGRNGTIDLGVDELIRTWKSPLSEGGR